MANIDNWKVKSENITILVRNRNTRVKKWVSLKEFEKLTQSNIKSFFDDVSHSADESGAVHDEAKEVKRLE